MSALACSRQVTPHAAIDWQTQAGFALRITHTYQGVIP
jgi:hypothetical protein